MTIRLLRLTGVLGVLAATSIAPVVALPEDAPWESQAASSVAIIDGAVQVRGLHHSVRVQRDSWGVAHIYAADQHDLFLAQGFVAAQDRLFQMELWKRSGQGRLAEILGPSAVKRDISARLLKYRGDMAAEYRSYAPDALQILQAFTEGINAYIERIGNSARPGIPVEFRIAGFAPEPWEPADCLNRVAAYSMLGNASSELVNAQLVVAIGAQRASELLELDPHVTLSPAPGLDLAGLTAGLLKDIVSSDARIPFPASTRRESNNWTVSGALTASGKPLLANDPHRVLAQPSLRYIVHLVAPGWNVIGAGEPALPGVATGHNDRIAWGFTIFGLDQQDLFVETLKPADPTQYRGAHGWEPIVEVRETIRVRGDKDVTAVLRFTANGPILYEDGTRALALRWVGSEPGTAGYLGSLSLDRARNWHEFERAMPRWKVPSENIVYADREGNIGEHSTGLAPLRFGFDGLLPVPADASHAWRGYLPSGALPHSFNPELGYIATANHRMIPENYPYAVGFEWAPPTRFLRISEVLEAARHSGHKLTLADMRALQTDTLSLPARQLLPLLRAALQDPGLPAPGPELASAAQLLLDWDCALRSDSAAAALYELWAEELRSSVTQLAVPAGARDPIGTLPVTRVVQMLTAPGNTYGGALVEPQRSVLLRDGLRTALARLTALQGGDPKRWSWGALHQAVFRHALDDIGGASLLDRGPIERAGDGDTVMATHFRDGAYEQTSGASYAQILDLSNWDHSVAINVPGQSGQPKAKHFDDLLPLWRAARYFPLSYSRSAVQAATTDVLLLEPGR